MEQGLPVPPWSVVRMSPLSLYFGGSRSGSVHLSLFPVLEGHPYDSSWLLSIQVFCYRRRARAGLRVRIVQGTRCFRLNLAKVRGDAIGVQNHFKHLGIFAYGGVLHQSARM